MEGLADPRIHICYHVKFGSSATQGVRIIEGTPIIGERWGPAPCGRGVADPLEIRSSPTRVILPNMVVLGQTV